MGMIGATKTKPASVLTPAVRSTIFRFIIPNDHRYATRGVAAAMYTSANTVPATALPARTDVVISETGSPKRDASARAGRVARTLIPAKPCRMSAKKIPVNAIKRISSKSGTERLIALKNPPGDGSGRTAAAVSGVTESTAEPGDWAGADRVVAVFAADVTWGCDGAPGGAVTDPADDCDTVRPV
jgi:hypothetical protein